MKFLTVASSSVASRSLPVRGAWVEILPARGWKAAAKRSLPVRGAWVEISVTKKPQKSSKVAPRAGSVG